MLFDSLININNLMRTCQNLVPQELNMQMKKIHRIKMGPGDILESQSESEIL